MKHFGGYAMIVSDHDSKDLNNFNNSNLNYEPSQSPQKIGAFWQFIKLRIAVYFIFNSYRGAQSSLLIQKFKSFLEILKCDIN